MCCDGDAGDADDGVMVMVIQPCQVFVCVQDERMALSPMKRCHLQCIAITGHCQLCLAPFIVNFHQRVVDGGRVTVEPVTLVNDDVDKQPGMMVMVMMMVAMMEMQL